MKFFKYVLVSVVMILCLSGCAQKGKQALPVIAATSEMNFESTTKQVKDFLLLNEEFTTSYEMDTCFNITPDIISENSSYSIFKYSSSTASFVMYDNNVYPLGEYFGGLGVTSLALADLNKDKQYELYFTFSWGSGLHRSQIGYFDPASKQVNILGYSHNDKDMMLTKSDEGDLIVNEAIVEPSSFTDFTVKSGDMVGTLLKEGDDIVLKK